MALLVKKPISDLLSLDSVGKKVVITVGKKKVKGVFLSYAKSRGYYQYIMVSFRNKRNELRYIHLYFHDNGKLDGHIALVKLSVVRENFSIVGTWYSGIAKLERFRAVFDKRAVFKVELVKARN